MLLELLRSKEAWDDPSIDRLLAMADTSGDGVLWFEEFVRWMLADDVGGKAQVSLGDGTLGYAQLLSVADRATCRTIQGSRSVHIVL